MMMSFRPKVVVLQFVLLILLFLSTISTATAEEKNFGFGIMAGEPTGLSANYFISQDNSIDLGVAWNISGNNDFVMHADYLWYLNDFFQVGKAKMPLYLGVGGRMVFRDNNSDKFGIRVPIGVSYRFPNPEFLELFGEVAPILDLAPSMKMDLNASVGVRFYLF